MKKLILIFLVLILAACSTTTASEADKNREKWELAGVTHYRYSLTISCFCAFRSQMPLVVEVQNGKVLSMTYPDGTLVESNDPSIETFTKYATIEKLFAELESGQAEEITSSYDASLGYPTEIRFDYIKAAMDDEITIFVADMETLK